MTRANSIAGESFFGKSKKDRWQDAGVTHFRLSGSKSVFIFVEKFQEKYETGAIDEKKQGEIRFLFNVTEPKWNSFNVVGFVPCIHNSCEWNSHMDTESGDLNLQEESVHALLRTLFNRKQIRLRVTWRRHVEFASSICALDWTSVKAKDNTKAIWSESLTWLHSRHWRIYKNRPSTWNVCHVEYYTICNSFAHRHHWDAIMLGERRPKMEKHHRNSLK